MTKQLFLGLALAGALACAAQNDDLPAVGAPAPSEPWEDPLEIIGEAEARTYYQYVDEAGNVRFVESIEEVPEAWRDQAGVVQLDVPPPHDPAEARMVRKLRDQRGE